MTHLGGSARKCLPGHGVGGAGTGLVLRAPGSRWGRRRASKILPISPASARPAWCQELCRTPQTCGDSPWSGFCPLPDIVRKASVPASGDNSNRTRACPWGPSLTRLPGTQGACCHSGDTSLVQSPGSTVRKRSDQAGGVDLCHLRSADLRGRPAQSAASEGHRPSQAPEPPAMLASAHETSTVVAAVLQAQSELANGLPARNEGVQV